MKNIKIKKIFFSSVLASSITLLTGCLNPYREAECNISFDHAHKYVNEDLLERYVISEREEISDWRRSCEYKKITDDSQKNLIEFESKNNLIDRKKNLIRIKRILSSLNDYKEYRYKYQEDMGYYWQVDDISYYVYDYQDRYSWTKDSEHAGLTGEERDISYVYFGYKIDKDLNNDYKLIESDIYDNYDDIPEEYNYIKEDFYKKINLTTGSYDIDYEDGHEEIDKGKDKQKVLVK